MTDTPLNLPTKLNELPPTPVINWNPSQEELAQVIAKLQSALDAMSRGDVVLTYEVELADHFDDDTQEGDDSIWHRITNWIDENALFKHIDHNQTAWDCQISLTKHRDFTSPIPEELRRFFDEARAMGCKRIGFFIC